MSNEIRETKFRLMVEARVFHRKADGVITQMYIDSSGVGYLPNDHLTAWEKAFVRKNADGLMLSVVLCLMGVAQAKTEEERAKAAHVVFSNDAAADAQSADAAKKLATEVLKQATEPVIQGLDEKGNPKKEG